MKNVGTVSRASHAPGERGSNSDGVRNGLRLYAARMSWVCNRSRWLAMQCLSPALTSASAQGWPPPGAGWASSSRSCTQVSAKPLLKMPPGNEVAL